VNAAPKRKRTWWSFLLAGLLCVVVALLYPVESTICPAWTIQVVDEAGRPLTGAFVRQHWQDYSVESRSREEDARTDANGYVSFSERTVSARPLRRALGVISNVLSQGVHASHGPHTFIAAYGRIVEGNGSQVTRPGPAHNQGG
jgi:hypothetical protein